MIDLVIIPFHDWRKVQREGARTRDAHLINHLAEHPEVRTVLILNRPVTLAELLYRRSGWKTKGVMIAASANSQLVRVNDNTFVIDYLETDLVRPALSGKKWFFRSYGDRKYIVAIERYLQMLGMNQFDCISLSVYASKLFRQLPARHKLFDAWDNFLKFPGNKLLQVELMDAYQSYASAAAAWTTNSTENQRYFLENYDAPVHSVIKNGVNVSRFSQLHAMPEDLVSLPRPLVGMGLKVTHLLDTELLNRLTGEHPEVAFVLIGQILDKRVFEAITKRPNFHYLGDKHYDVYAAYVQHFDACLIPYHTGDRQHGGDAIKFYEYLAASKPIVSTRGNGVTSEYAGVWVADSHEEFSRSLSQALACGLIKRDLPADITWGHKADTLLHALLYQAERSCQITN